MDNKVIFWDFDGTLSCSNKRFENALYESLLRVGIYADRDTAYGFMAKAYPWKAPFEDHTKQTGQLWWKAMFSKVDGFCLAHGIEKELFSAIHRELKILLTAVDNYCLYEDTLQTLDACIHKGYRNFLLTNNYPEILENVEKLGIAPYLSGFVVSSLVGYDKPRQELYAYAKALADEPELCYMVGDNPIADIAGGNAAGMKTVCVHNGYLETASFSADSLKQILSILE